MSGQRKRRATLRPLARLTGQDAVWTVVREFGADERPFTTRAIAGVVIAGRDLVRDYLDRLTAAGILEATPPAARGLPTIYRLVRDCGVEAPRVTRDGRLDAAPTDQERMWQAMKALPTFDARDLQVSTGIGSGETVRTYLRHLLRAGYLMIVAPERPGYQGKPARYRLVPSRNTGPRPPAIRRGRVVFDANLGRQVWP